MTLEERTTAMVQLYGEVCTKSQAARILGRTPQTVYKMIADERLDLVCGTVCALVANVWAYLYAYTAGGAWLDALVFLKMVEIIDERDEDFV